MRKAFYYPQVRDYPGSSHEPPIMLKSATTTDRPDDIHRQPYYAVDELDDASTGIQTISFENACISEMVDRHSSMPKAVSKPLKRLEAHFDSMIGIDASKMAMAGY